RLGDVHDPLVALFLERTEGAPGLRDAHAQGAAPPPHAERVDRRGEKEGGRGPEAGQAADLLGHDGQLLVPGGDARRPWRRRRRRRSLGNLPRGPVSASWWRAGQGLELETQLEGAIDGSIDELEGGVAGEGEGRPGVVA